MCEVEVTWGWFLGKSIPFQAFKNYLFIYIFNKNSSPTCCTSAGFSLVNVRDAVSVRGFLSTAFVVLKIEPRLCYGQASSRALSFSTCSYFPSVLDSSA